MVRKALKRNVRANSFPPQALQQLLQTLKSPQSQQQQKQVLHILKSNPSLMAAFIKQRSQLQQQQQAAQAQQQQQEQQRKRKLDSAEDNCIHPPSEKKPKALKPDELPQALMPTPEQNAESIPVQQPVDPKTLQIPERSVYTCNECKQRVDKRYHCTVCEDYDLCSNCYQKISHNHKMEKLDLEPDVDSDSNSDASRNPQEARRLSIQRCIQSLVHACQCHDANCQLSSCQKMKRVVQHTKVCQRKTNGECPTCKQLIALCCYHAKHCQEQICLVPFCLNIKRKLRQQQLQHRLQQAQHRRQQVQLLRQGMKHAGA